MGVSALLSKMLKQTFNEYVPLETVLSDHIVSSPKGELISMISVNGINDILAGDDMADKLDAFSGMLRGQFEGGSSQLQIVFQYDPDSSERTLNKMLGPAREACKNIGLNDKILIDSTIEKVSLRGAEESCYLILYTTFDGLTGAESGAHIKKIKAKAKKGNQPFWRAGQNMFVESDVILQRHISFFEAVNEGLRNISVHSELMGTHACIRALRESLEPDYVSKDWSPLLPGDKVPIRNFPDGSHDMISYPRIAEQVLTVPPFIHGNDVLCGGKIYRPFIMKTPPRRIMRFDNLFNRMPKGVPWRVSFHLQSGVMSGSGLKIMIANFTSWMMASNKRIRNGWEYLSALDSDNNDAIVGWRASGVTWAADAETLELRYAQVIRAFEGWGEAKVTSDSCDPFESLLGTAPMLSKDSLQAAMPAAPLNDIMATFPLFRPNLPWAYGGLLFSALDGKPMPMEMASSEQTMWNSLLFAPPGSGKSVLLLNMVIALILRGGNRELPKIGIIDIGPTSRGLINMLKFLLPESKKHLVGRFRLQFNDKYSINILDTHLGNRKPLSIDKDFIVNLISMLATPSGMERPYPNTSEVISMAVTASYRFKAEEGANKYVKGVSEDVDSALEASFETENVDKHTTWWEIVDMLFLKGRKDAASTAQRHAVPLLADVARLIVQDQGIKDMYGVDAINGEGVQLLHALSRNITAAIADFGIFSKPTIFNVDRMKIVALDLDEVAKSRGKKTAIMYMVARHVLAKTYYFDKDHIAEFPAIYQEHYESFLLENRAMAKGLVMDEFHRTAPLTGKDSASEIVQAQVKVDMREGRKFNVVISLASQEFHDFNEEIINLSSTRYILGYGSKKEADEMCSHLGLSTAGRIVITKHLHGPGPSGSNLLINYKTKKGEFSQAATLVCSSDRLWFLSTVAEDEIVLATMFKHFPQKDAIDFLAKKFPGGSAKREIEQRLERETGSSSEELTSEETKAAAESFALQLVESVRKHGFEHA